MEDKQILLFVSVQGNELLEKLEKIERMAKELRYETMNLYSALKVKPEEKMSEPTESETNRLE